MMIDKELQEECYKQSLRRVAKNYDVTQTHLKKLMAKKGTGKPRQIYEYCLINAVKNWTVELYNRELRQRYGY